MSESKEVLVRALSRVPWDMFISPTYASSLANGNSLAVPTPPVRRCILFEFIRRINEAYNIPDGCLLYVAREEFGELNGRAHWHILLGGLHHIAGRGIRPSPNIKSDTYRLIALWKKCGKSAGIVDSRAFDARLSGVDYIMKGLKYGDYSTDQANAYEMNKFCEDEEGRQLILAPSVLRYLALRSRNRRHQKARDMKLHRRDRSARGISNYVKPDRLSHPYDDATTRLYV